MFDDIKDSPQSISNKEDNKGENLGANKEFASSAAPKDSVPAPAPESALPVQPRAGTVDDIFAETEKKERPEVFNPKAVLGESGDAPEYKSEVEKKGKGRKIIILAIIIAGGLLLGSGVYLAYDAIMDSFSGDTDSEDLFFEETASDDTETENTESTNQNNNKDNTVIPEQPLDSDQDGLTDEEEKALGMDINNVDSDGDGLFDREEVKTYKTNPLLRDSDGDGFLDGAEVKGGYDPNGPGKLYEIE